MSKMTRRMNNCVMHCRWNPMKSQKSLDLL